MKGTTKRFFSIILSAILLIAAIVIYTTFILPEYGAVNNLRAEASAKQNTLDNQRQIVNKVGDLLTQYRSIPDLASVISLLLPADEDIASIFQQIYALAVDSGLNIQQFGVNTNVSVQSARSLAGSAKGASSIIKSLGTAQINLNLIGSYAAGKKFLRLLEHNIRIMDINSLKIQPVSQSSQDLYFFNLIINTYYQTN